MGFASRLLCFSTLLFASLTGFSQEKILIPYKSEEKFGLCDETGKVVIAPVYDKVEYLEQHYFVFGNMEIQIDTAINSVGKPFIRKNEIWSVGILENDRILIPQQEFQNFFFYDHFIIVSEGFFQPQNFYIYNLLGEKVHDERINFFYYNESNDLGALAESSDRFTFLSLHYGPEPGQSEKFSLAVYDNVLQKIDNWLVKDVTQYEYYPRYSLPDLIYIMYADKEGRWHQKYIHKVNGRFEAVYKKDLSPEERTRVEERKKEIDFDNSWIYEREIEEAPYPSMAEKPERKVYNPSSDPHYIGYALLRDTLYYLSAGEKDVIVKPMKNSELIYFLSADGYQSGAIIYKKKDKFGLLVKGTYSKVLYDSLLYYGPYFIAAIEKREKLHFGLLNGEGTVLLPLEYDSMQGMTKELEVIRVRSGDSVHYSIQLQERQLLGRSGYGYPGDKNPYVRMQTPGIFVYKGDKCGVITEMGKVIIPIEYDTITYNGMDFSSRITNYLF